MAQTMRGERTDGEALLESITFAKALLTSGLDDSDTRNKSVQVYLTAAQQPGLKCNFF